MTSTLDPRRAAAVLRAGGLVAFPTETVYGLGAVCEDPASVARIYRAKGRPEGHPLIVHGADASVLDRYASAVMPGAAELAEALWPGPITLILPRSHRVPDIVTGGRDTVGLRVPRHELALRMLAELDGLGVAAPSANPFGRVSPTSAADVAADLGDAVDLILDGGTCSVGVESTIVDLSGPRPVLLRAGGVGVERLREILGDDIRTRDVGPARAPGMLEAHYAPGARVVVARQEAAGALVAQHARDGARVVVVALTVPSGLPGGVPVLTPWVRTVEGYARSLYRMLRTADDLGARVVVAVPPPPGGVGDAVRDRLRRAAAASGQDAGHADDGAGTLGGPHGGADAPDLGG